MRLLMLNNEYPPLGGGQGVVNATLLKHFAAIPDLSIDLITANRSKAEWETKDFSERIKIHFVPVGNKNIHHSTAKELSLFGIRAYRKSCELIRQGANYDLSFAFSTVPAGFVSWRLFKRHQIPYLVRSPGVDIPGFEARYGLVYPILAPFIREIWSRSQGFVVSSSMHADLALRHDPSAPVKVIVNAVNLGEFYPGAASDSEKLRILCVARLVKRKGVDDLFQALKLTFDQVPGLRGSVQLRLAGTGDDETQLRQLARDLGIDSQVEFLGFVERSRLPELYRGSDLFVLPSHNEGMSNAALEALASGLPLVLTAVGGSDELVDSGVNGYVVSSKNVRELSRVLTDLLTDRSKMQAMGRSSRERAAAFDWSAVTLQYLETIKNAAFRPSPSSL